MSGDEKFWLGFWAIVGTTFLIVLGMCHSYYHKQDQMLVEMVKGGADPVLVNCALSGCEARDLYMYITTKKERSVE